MHTNNSNTVFTLNKDLFWIPRTDSLAIGVMYGVENTKTYLFQFIGKASQLITLLDEGPQTLTILSEKIQITEAELLSLVNNLVSNKIIHANIDFKVNPKIKTKTSQWEVIVELDNNSNLVALATGEYCGNVSDGFFPPCPVGLTCQPGSSNWCDPWFCAS
jgi:hypothetical protein